MKRIALFIIALIIVVGIILIVGGNGSDLSSTPGSCVTVTLAQGTSGHCVSDVQQLLNWGLYGIDTPNYKSISGQFNASTTTVVKLFQSTNSLSQTGSVNKITWERLCESSDAPPSWTTAAKDAGCKV
jgi:peptidoglycan hydrolase-like protein with peptidoglycan-binding domain